MLIAHVHLSSLSQPFTTTKGALQRGSEDNRSKGFAHVMSMLAAMDSPPRWIFFENVKGFRGSTVHSEWSEVLRAKGYVWEEFLLSPTNFRRPNQRMRFYMACELSAAPGGGGGGAPQETSPYPAAVAPPGVKRLQSWVLSDESLKAELGELNFASLLVPDRILSKPWAQGLSYVGVGDRITFCFTSAYGKTYHKSSGSLLHRTITRGKDVGRPGDMSSAHSGAVRLFAPLELLRLFGFPETYRFPDEMKLRHRFKLIGQSVNVAVVEHVMRTVFWRPAA
jgi:tRNA (cytosine38-C5)-methyltransferase